MALSQDRTAEFRSAVKAQLHGLRQRPQKAAPAPRSERSLFFRQASALAQDIADTAQMTQRLALLAKRPPMFDDNPREMEELMGVITQKIAQVRSNTDSLEKQLPDLGGTKKDEQVDTLSKNVVKSLHGSLREMTKTFSTVLEERSRRVESGRQRAANFIAPTAVSSAGAPTSNPLYQENPFAGVSDVTSNDGNDELLLPTQEQSMVLLEDQQSSYLTQRSTAVDAIESTINELGQMFGQLTSILAEQSETVQRIDANTEDIDINVSGAHRELLKFYARVSSNRGLMLKSFGVIIVMFFLWVLLS